MKIPVFTRQKFIDDDGFLTARFQQDFDIFFQQCQINLSDFGLVVPQKNTVEINNIATDSQNPKPNGTLWYDSQTNQLKVKINGLVKVVTVT